MTLEERQLLEEKYGGKETSEFKADVERLASGEPLAYVIGYQPFLGLKIYLDSKPLIPRPETEWWTEKLLKEIEGTEISETLGAEAARPIATPKGVASQFATARVSATSGRASRRVLRNFSDRDFKFLDLCAGSGAIGCAALARLPNAHVYFGEIDPAHQATIEKNIRENKLDASRAHIGIGDLFAPFTSSTFDVIAINPPYIPANRILERSVADYEPSLALFSGTDGLDIMRRIATELPTHLAKDGVAWIEIDSAAAAAAAALFEAQGFSAHIHTDQYGRSRVICITD